MEIKVTDRVQLSAHPDQVGTVIEINGRNLKHKLARWLLFKNDSGLEYYVRDEELTLLKSNTTMSTNSTVKFLDKWKRVFNVYSLEIHCGVKRNTIAHSISKEKRPMDPFEEGKILEVLKQMKRDIEKLKLP